VVDNSLGTILHGLFTEQQPVGPPAIDPDLPVEALAAIYLADVQPYDRDTPPHQSTYIMGRRGSGKTMLLLCAGGLQPNSTVNLHRDDVLTGMRDLVVTIERDLNFTLSLANQIDIWRATFAIAAASQLAHETLGESHVTERIQLRQFLAHLKRVSKLPITEPNGLVRAFEEHLVTEARAHIQGPLRTWLDGITIEGVSVRDVTTSVKRILSGEKRQLTVLVDSLEELTGKPDRYREVLRPLFALLGNQARRGVDYPGLHIRCCLPTEILDRLPDLSENTAKDFEGVCNIHWKTDDLIVLIAARLRTLARVLHDQGKPNLLRYFEDNPNEPRSFLDSLLPAQVTNSCGIPESTLPYILRHTQMLPRQLLRLFNTMFGGQERIERLARGARLNPRDVVQAVLRAENQLCLEVINAQRNNYKGVADFLATIVPNLPHRFTRDELRTLYQDLSLRRYSDNFADCLTSLIKLGVIGRVHLETDHYIRGEFSYTFPSGLVPAQDDELCLHPMFSRFKGRRASPHKPIYPAPAQIEDDIVFRGILGPT
jgi:hypothetical protein